jgi:hypothetical protein
MTYSTLNALLYTSDQMLASGDIVHPASLPDRVSPIQVALDRIAAESPPKPKPPARTRPVSKRSVAIARAQGSAQAVADRFGVTQNTVFVYRCRYR